MLWGCEGRPGSPADEQGDALQLADKSVLGILHQLTNLNVLGNRRYLFQESYVVGEVSAFWAFKACPPSRGSSPQRCGESEQAEAIPLLVRGPKAGRACGSAKRGPKSRLNVAVDHQWSPSESTSRLLSDPESSDEFSEIELMRMSNYPKDGGQAKLNRPEDPRNTPRCLNVQGRENLRNVPATCLSSAPPGLISVVERQGRQGLQSRRMPRPLRKCRACSGGKGAAWPATRE